MTEYIEWWAFLAIAVIIVGVYYKLKKK